MKNYVIGLFILLVLSACGKDCKPVPPASVSASASPEEVEQANINQVVYEENLYRYNNLSAQLSKGLDCTVYKTQYTGNIGILGVGSAGLGTLTSVVRYPYQGYFAHSTNNQSDGLSFIPEVYRSQSSNQQEVYVRCTGVIVVTTTKLHMFQYRSDDNLVMTVNGVSITNAAVDDVNHGAYAVAGKQVSLQAGRVYSIDIKYRQFNGASVLQLYQNGDWLNPKYLYH